MPALRPGRSPRSCVAPLRTKMSSTSLTRVRSSRIAAATVFISRTLGADSVSLESSACTFADSTSSRRNDCRTPAMRGPALPARAT